MCGYEEEEEEEYDALCIHTNNVTRNAATQAIAHWKARIIMAHVVPSSLRMVAIAAIQGV